MPSLSNFDIYRFLQFAILIVAVGLIILAVCRQMVPRWAAHITRDLGPIIIVLVILALLLGTLFEWFQFGGRNGNGNGPNGPESTESVIGPTTMIGNISHPLVVRMTGSVRSAVTIDGGYHSEIIVLQDTDWADQLHKAFTAKPWSEVLPADARYATFEYDRFVPENARLAMIGALDQNGFQVIEKRIER